MSNTIPPDSRIAGQTGHVTDHNNISDVLTAIQTQANSSSAAITALQNIASTALNAATDFGADPTGAIDSSTAISNAVAAGISASTPVYLPAGTYTANNDITGLTAGFSFVGAPGGGTVINSNNATGVWQFPTHGFSYVMYMQDFTVNYTGAGAGFTQIGTQNSVFRNVNVNLTNGGAYAMFTNQVNTGLLNAKFENCTINSSATSRSVPLVSFTNALSGGISGVTFDQCFFGQNGVSYDTTQFMVYVACSAGTQASYHMTTVFRDCWFEKPLGGAIKLLSAQAAEIDSCYFWDMHNNGTPGNSIIYIGAYSGGAGSEAIRITNCGRNASSVDGSTTFDVECESTTAQLHIEGYSTKATSASSATNAFFNLHNCNDAILISNTTPQGSGINGNSTTVVTNPALSQVSLQDGVVSANSLMGVQPQDFNWLLWNFDAALATSTQTLATGTIYLARFKVRSAISVTNILIGCTTAGGTLTAGQSFAGIYNSSGTVVATSADESTSWSTGTGLKTNALVSGPFTLNAGAYWVALMSNWTGSGPIFAKQAGAAATNVSNYFQNAANSTQGTAGTGTTSLPSITPGSITATQSNLYWFALS